MSWTELSTWWLDELRDDPSYETIVTPLLLDVLQPTSEALYLDLGCGDGRVMRSVRARGGRVFGVDISEELAGRSPGVVVAELPGIPVANRSVDGCYAVLVIEHVADHGALFAECSRVTRRGGVLALVANHPVWTAPGSTPITDSDGEVLWRPGDYFSSGLSEVPAGDETVVFHHRTMAALLNAATSSGWQLEELVERPHHDLTGQEGIPRLLACRWRRS